MKKVFLTILCLFVLSRELIATDTSCPVVEGFNLSALAGDWQTVGYDTCEGCAGLNFLNLSLCGPLEDHTCGEGVSVCFLNSLLYAPGGHAVSAGIPDTRQVDYNNDTRALTITYDYYLESQRGTTTIVLFCGRHLGVPRVTGSSIKSYRMSVEWETDLMCERKHLVENRCYLVRFDYAYFTPYLYDLTPLIKSEGAYVITPNGGSQRFALNLCQEIVPDSSLLLGCEGAVLCELIEGGNRPVIMAEGSQGVQDIGDLLSIQYSSPPANQASCGGNAVLSILFHCPYEFDISPGPRMIIRDSDCYFHVDWYTDHACAQRYSKNQGCLIEGTSRNPFKFDLTALGGQNYTIPDGSYSYDIRICDSVGVQCNGVQTKVCEKDSRSEWDLGSDEGVLNYQDGQLTLAYSGRRCTYNKMTLPTSTILNFVCSQNNTGPTFVEKRDCSYFFEWPTPLACPSVSPHTGSCTDVTFGEYRYDISHLKRGDQENWVAGIGAFVETNTSSNFLLNLCGVLNTEGSSQTSAPSSCSGYGVCETTDKGNSFGIGKFTQVYARPGNVLVARYTDGVCPVDGNKQASVNLVIICKVGVTDSSPVYVGEYGCEYEFQWEHAAACPTSNRVTYGQECKVRDPATLYTYDLSSLRNKQFHLSTSSYEYYLSICSGLNASLGEKCSGAGACQVSDSSAFSLGGVNSTLQFSNGTLQMQYVGGNGCSGGVSRSTLVSFACDLNSTGLKEVEDPEKSHCSYYFIMYTDRACPFEYYFIKCSYTDSDGHTYDLSPLIRQFDNWNGTASSGVTSSLREARFYINVCRPVNNVPYCHPLSSACMRIQTDDGQIWISLGKPMTGLRPVGGNAKYGLRVVYTEDEPANIPGVCNATTPQTGITFLCPQTAQASRLSYPRLIGVDTSGCIFEFEWYTKLACAKTEIPVTATCSVQDPESGFVFSFLSLEGTRSVHSENASDTTPSFYLSICSSVDADNIQSSLTSSPSSNTGSLIYYTDSSSGNNASLGEANSDVRYSDGELIQLEYTDGAQCLNGNKKSTLITFVCSHYLTDSVSYIGSPSSITADTCIFEFEYKTILACPPIITECVVSSAGGVDYDLTKLKQLSSTGFPVSLSTHNEISNANLKISVCQPLEAGSATSCTNGSASCLSYNGHHLDLGRVTGGLQLSENGELQLLYSGGTGCDKSAITVVTFRCDTTAGVGQPFLSLHKNTSGSCYYEVVWETGYACPVTPTQASSCAVTDPDTGFAYNFTSLRDGPDLNIASNLTAYDTIYQYGFTFSVCRPIQSSCGTDYHANTGACQSSSDKQYVTGLANSELTLEDGEVKLIYTGGDMCNRNSVNRSTIIRFYCDHEATSPHPVVLPETTHCLYEILLYTHLACPPQQPQYECKTSTANSQYIYDLSTLQYRNVYEVYYSSDTVFYFSVCGMLPSIFGDKGVTCSETSFCVLHASNNVWTATDIGTMTQPPYLSEDNLLVLSYSTSDMSHNTSVFLTCPEEDQAAGDPRVVSYSSDFSLNLFSWKTIAACRSAPSNTCQMVQYGTGYTIDLDEFPVVSVSPGNSGIGGSLTIALCSSISDSALGECNDKSTAVCLTKDNTYHRIATNDTSKWFYGDNIVISYYNGFTCLDSSSKFPSTVEVLMQCGTSDKQTVLERSDECVYRVQWDTPSLCQYQVECSVEEGGQQYDLNWLKAFDNNWRVNFNGDLFLINVCHNLLPEEKQKCPASAATCMLNGTHAVSLGQVSSRPEYVSEGKLRIEYVGGDPCGDGTYSATIVFNCEKGADLEEYITMDKSECHYTFNWATHTACADNGGTVYKECKISDNVTGDVFDLEPIFKLVNVSVSNDPSYQIMACQVFNDYCQGASVCYNNNHNFGKYSGNANLKIVNHFPVLEYGNGEKCGSTGVHESRIEFVCNKSAVDSKYVEHLPVSGGCKHYFLWHTPLACGSTVTECIVSVANRVVDLSDLNKKYGAWEVDVGTSHKIYFNPCYGMNYFLENTTLESASCSSDSLACISKGGVLYEVGSLDTAVLKVSADGKYPIERARSQTKCNVNKSKTNSVKILFYPGDTMMGTPSFVSSIDTPSSCESSIIFETSLVSDHPPINEYGALITTEKSGECHDAISRLSGGRDHYFKTTRMGETLHFYINFCAYANEGRCKDASVCLFSTAESSPLSLSSYRNQRVSITNSSIELIMSTTDGVCKLTNKPILTVFYITCSPQHQDVSIELLHISPAGCLYAFSVSAPDSVCSLYTPTEASSPMGVLSSSVKTAVVFIVVLVVCLLCIFLAILLTMCYVKRSNKGDRVFYRLKAYLSGVPDSQFRFKRTEGSEVGHLISNLSESESDDEMDSEQRIAPRVESDKFVIAAAPDDKEGSEDEDFIKL